MRALTGLLLLVALAFGGLEHLSRLAARLKPDGAQATLAATAPVAADPAPAGPRVITQTVAASDPLAPVTVAPDAPRAAPIEPIVTPLPKAVPKAAAPTKAKPKPAAARPGFKLTCAATQKLDAARKKCVSLKGTTVAGVAKKV